MKKEISDYLNTLSPLQKQLVGDIREIVLGTDSAIEETIKWGSICFTHHGNLCGFRVAKTHVTLLFFEGSGLKGHSKILSGDGPKARTIKHDGNNQLDKAVIQDLVQQCIKLNR